MSGANSNSNIDADARGSQGDAGASRRGSVDSERSNKSNKSNRSHKHKSKTSRSNRLREKSGEKASRTKEKVKRNREHVQRTLFKLKESQRRLDFQRERRASMRSFASLLDEEELDEDVDTYEKLVSAMEQTNLNGNKIQEQHAPASASATAEGKRLAKGDDGDNRKLISILQDTNRQHEETIKKLQRQLSESQTNHKTQLDQSHSEKVYLKTEAKTYKGKYDKLGKMYGELIEKMAIKAKQQIASHTEKKDAELVQWKERHNQMGHSYDELIKKVEDLACENGDLTVKCQQLQENETELEEVLSAMEELQAENEALHESIKAMEEAMHYASGVSETMEVFVAAHEADVDGYEKKLASLNMDKMRAIVKGRVLQRELDELKKDSSVQGNEGMS